jgi:hypothetical protein
VHALVQAGSHAAVRKRARGVEHLGTSDALTIPHKLAEYIKQCFSMLCGACTHQLICAWHLPLLPPQVPEPEKPDSVFAQLQGLFAQLALSKATFAQPYLFWAAFKDYDGTPIDVREHQDAYEFFTRLQVRLLSPHCVCWTHCVRMHHMHRQHCRWAVECGVLL